MRVKGMNFFVEPYANFFSAKLSRQAVVFDLYVFNIAPYFSYTLNICKKKLIHFIKKNSRKK